MNNDEYYILSPDATDAIPDTRYAVPKYLMDIIYKFCMHCIVTLIFCLNPVVAKDSLSKQAMLDRHIEWFGDQQLKNYLQEPRVLSAYRIITESGWGLPSMARLLIFKDGTGTLQHFGYREHPFPVYKPVILTATQVNAILAAITKSNFWDMPAKFQYIKVIEGINPVTGKKEILEKTLCSDGPSLIFEAEEKDRSHWTGHGCAFVLLIEILDAFTAIKPDLNGYPTYDEIRAIGSIARPPEGVKKTDRYKGYYAYSMEDDRKIIKGVFTLMKEGYSHGSSVLVVYAPELPVILGGGCSVINLKWDVEKRELIELRCNDEE